MQWLRSILAICKKKDTYWHNHERKYWKLTQEPKISYEIHYYAIVDAVLGTCRMVYHCNSIKHAMQHSVSLELINISNSWKKYTGLCANFLAS